MRDYERPVLAIWTLDQFGVAGVVLLFASVREVDKGLCVSDRVASDIKHG